MTLYKKIKKKKEKEKENEKFYKDFQNCLTTVFKNIFFVLQKKNIYIFDNYKLFFVLCS